MGQIRREAGKSPNLSHIVLAKLRYVAIVTAVGWTNRQFQKIAPS